MNVIKRYKNRKLYDTAQSQYITLNDVLNYVLNNQPVQIVNEINKEDITTFTLLNALAEASKKRNNNEVVLLLNNLSNYLKGDNNEQIRSETPAVVQQ